MVCISSLDNEIKLIKKGKSAKETNNVFYYPTDVVWNNDDITYILLIRLITLIIHNEHVMCLFFVPKQHHQFYIFSWSRLVSLRIILGLFDLTNLHLRLSSKAFWLIILNETFSTFLLRYKDLFGSLISIFPFVWAERSNDRFLKTSC